jgi:hypothetical protein
MSLADEIASADVLLDVPGTLTPRTLTPRERTAIVTALRSVQTEVAKPTESPLAWLVFVSDHPEGWDYVVFPDEHEAETYAAEREDREVTPLYRTSAFVVSPHATTSEKPCSQGE